MTATTNFISFETCYVMQDGSEMRHVHRSGNDFELDKLSQVLSEVGDAERVGAILKGALEEWAIVDTLVELLSLHLRGCDPFMSEGKASGRFVYEGDVAWFEFESGNLFFFHGTGRYDLDVSRETLVEILHDFHCIEGLDGAKEFALYLLSRIRHSTGSNKSCVGDDLFGIVAHG